MSGMARRVEDRSEQVRASDWLDMFGELPVHNPTMQLPRVRVSEPEPAEAAPVHITPMRTQDHARDDASVELGGLLARFWETPMMAFNHAPRGAAITATVLAEVGVDPAQLDRAWYRDSRRAVWVKVGEPAEAVLRGGSRHGQVVKLPWSHPWDQLATFRHAGNPSDVWRVTPIRDQGNRVVFQHGELTPQGRFHRLRAWARRLLSR